MIFFHTGGALFLFRWIFRDPKVDIRFLLLGALIPDIIDLPLGTLLLAETFSSGELWAHTLAAPTVAAAVVLVSTRRGRTRRAWMAGVVGWFFHLLLDGMWMSTEVFFWPFAGLDFPRGPDPYWAGALQRAMSDPVRWIAEALGLAYLIALARRLDGASLSELIRTGRLA